MNLTGEVVKHKKFGIGTIVEFKNDYITVLFEETKEQKMFLYPEAIGDFLELQNKSYSDKEQEIRKVEKKHEGEHEQSRIKDIKSIVKRENIIKKMIKTRQKDKK